MKNFSKKKKLIKLIEVNSTYKANLLKSLLESNGINVVLKNEISHLLQPDITFGIQGIEILVEEENLKRAKKLISQ